MQTLPLSGCQAGCNGPVGIMREQDAEEGETDGGGERKEGKRERRGERKRKKGKKDKEWRERKKCCETEKTEREKRFRLEAEEVGVCTEVDECARTDSDSDINIQASRLRLGVGNFLLHVSDVPVSDNPGRSKKKGTLTNWRGKLCFINHTAAITASLPFARTARRTGALPLECRCPPPIDRRRR